MKRIHFVLALTLAAVVLGSGCSPTAPEQAPAAPKAAAPVPATGTAAPTVLKFNDMMPSTGANPKWVWSPFAREVERRTEGRVKVEIYPSETLSKIADAVEAVKSGVADISFFVMGYNPGRFPAASIAELPFPYPTNTAGSNILNVLKHRGWFDKEFADVKLLSIYGAEPQHLFTKKRITNLQELQGLKIRAYSDWQLRTLKKLGAVPSFVALGEVFTALQTGVLDGAMGGAVVLNAFRISDAAKYMLDLGIIGGGVAILMNKDKFAKLSEKDQRTMEWLGEWAGLHFSNVYDYPMGELARRNFVAKGNTIVRLSPEELERWKGLTSSLYDEWVKEMNGKGYPGDKMMKEFLELRQQLGYMETKM